MEKKALLIPSFCSGGFVFLGFRYGMYAHEGWPLTISTDLGQMLIWGISHALAVFLLTTGNMFFTMRNTRNYQAKLVFFTFVEVLGIGIPSGAFVIKGLIGDMWYLPTLVVFASVTAFMSILYVSIRRMKQAEEKLDKSESRLLDRLKLEHAKHLQVLNSMCWVIVFSIIGYLTAFFARILPFFEIPIPIFPASTYSTLFIVDAIGVIYFSLGVAFGVLGQMIERVNQIEDMIFRLPD